MALRSDFCRAISVVVLSFHPCKSTVSFTFPAPRSDSKSNKLAGLEKGTSPPSHTNTPTFTLVKSILVLKYNETDLMRIIKIFSKAKDQEPKAKVLYKQPLKAKISNMYFKKLHMD